MCPEKNRRGSEYNRGTGGWKTLRPGLGVWGDQHSYHDARQENMTAQVSDYLIMGDIEYSIAAIQENWPFNPKEHGFEPVSPHTVCWRGYYCKYSLRNKKLYLESLYVCLGDVKPVKWSGAEPQKGEYFKFDKMWKYRPQDFFIPYSGGLIIAHDFIREFYVHMGFHRPHCFRTVKELIFSDGYLENETDYSNKMKHVRDHLRFVRNGKEVKTPTNEEIERYVTEAFSLSYDKKWA